MTETHLIGNGTYANYYNPDSLGPTLTCNLPPFPVPRAFATAIVDRKMMAAIREGSLIVPGMWVLGIRPKKFCETNGSFYMKYAPQIKEFYDFLPPYIPPKVGDTAGQTAWSCGHMGAHYLATKFKPSVVHMYGFNSLFDFDLRSCSDFYLQSDRAEKNTLRLADCWRWIWPKLFAEFPAVKWKLYGPHANLKLEVPDNVEVEKR